MGYAEQYAVGAQIQPVELESQHGKKIVVHDSVRVILFSQDMEGGEIIKKGLESVGPEYLEERGAVYIANISAMPKLVAKMFALPAMRKRPYPILLDRDGKASMRLPAQSGRATIIHLDKLVIKEIAYIGEASDVRDQLER